MNEKRPNYRKQSCCGNCAHSFEENDGAHFCDVADTFTQYNAQLMNVWRMENNVFPGAVCDNWKPGEENLP